MLRTRWLASAIGVALLGAVGAASAQTNSPHAARCAGPPVRTTAAYRAVPGVAADLTSLDLYARRPACRRAGRRMPVVMWVHGGGYAIGDKANKVADKVAWSASHGYLFVSVNYRLTRAGDPASAQYPDHFRDVAAAVAWVRAHIGRYGGDPRRIALLGHSAGADIVSNVTIDPRWLAEHKLGLSAVRCAGPLDTEGFDKARSAAGAGGEKDAWRAALGNLPTYEHDTSATYLVRPNAGIPPTITVSRGTARRQAIEGAFAEALRAAAVPTTVIDARSLSHPEVSTRIGAAGDTVMTPPLTRFLHGCLGR